MLNLRAESRHAEWSCRATAVRRTIPRISGQHLGDASVNLKIKRVPFVARCMRQQQRGPTLHEAASTWAAAQERHHAEDLAASGRVPTGGGGKCGECILSPPGRDSDRAVFHAAARSPRREAASSPREDSAKLAASPNHGGGPYRSS
ncbi:hypothetical protein MRX96_054907 [Rhipicephalus microplus]